MKKFHSVGRRQYDLHCQLSAMSLQAAIPEGDSEEEPLQPTDRQAINHKIKKLQDLKEKSEKLKSSIQKENAQRFTKKSGKIISGQECGQHFNEKCLEMIAELQSNIDQTQKGPIRKTQENVSFCRRNICLKKEKSERK